MSLKDTKIQDWTIEEKELFLNTLKEFDKNYTDITIVGSRISDEFKIYSDLDVVIYVDENKSQKSFIYEDIMISVYFQSFSDFHKLVLNKYKLPLYSLLNDKFYNGIEEDIIEYKKWKNRGKIKK